MTDRPRFLDLRDGGNLTQREVRDFYVGGAIFIAFGIVCAAAWVALVWWLL